MCDTDRRRQASGGRYSSYQFDYPGQVLVDSYNCIWTTQPGYLIRCLGRCFSYKHTCALLRRDESMLTSGFLRS